MTFRRMNRVLVPIASVCLLVTCGSEDGGSDAGDEASAEAVVEEKGAVETPGPAESPDPTLRTENLPEDVRAEIRNSDRPVLVYFFAPWHQASTELATDVAKLAPEIRVMQINVDERPAVVKAFGVEGVPALYLWEGGQVVDAIPKGMTADSMDVLLEEHL